MAAVWRVEVVDALQQRHGVRLHLADILQLDVGQHHQVLLYGQIDLARHLKFGVLQDAVIGDDRSRDGVLDSHHAHVGIAALDGGCHASESVLRHYADVAAEIVVGRYVVETPLVTLYRYFKHPSCRLKKILTSHGRSGSISLVHEIFIV